MAYTGEIRMFGGRQPPANWAVCVGQIFRKADFPELFDLIGTTYGGDGQTTFGLPDLQGRAPVHRGTLANTTFSLGARGGAETVTLTHEELPTHAHRLQSLIEPATTSVPEDAFPAGAIKPSVHPYSTSAPVVALDPIAITPSGGGEPHDNMQPYQAVNFIIALQGFRPDAAPGPDEGPFIGEIRVFPYRFVPSGWLPCDGRVLQVAQNRPLFAVISDNFGGDGTTTFGLPDLQAAAPIGAGQGKGLSNRGLGETGGSNTVTLTDATSPGHGHGLMASGARGSSAIPGSQLFATYPDLGLYAPPSQTVTLNTSAITDNGGGRAHNNRQPFLGLELCIAIAGVFPAGG
jgi:microcystin-dependent protein